MSTPNTVSSSAARLALADGTVYHGTPFGARGLRAVGEVVFNTAMCGYQESLTDPSYTGQILAQTFPMIGNYGTNAEDTESRKVQVAGFVVRELTAHHSNYRASESLDAYLVRHGVPGIAGVDTRALTRRIRSAGAMQGVLTDRADLTDTQLVDLARGAPSMAGQNLVPRVGCTSGQTWTETLGAWGAPAPEKPAFRVLTLDCGAKANILRNLTTRGCAVRIVPHDTPPEEIVRLYRSGEIDGLFISNGPGDPAAVEATIQTLRAILEQDERIPTFGICLGHQLLALATGATTYKLKFGHRGANQPILNARSGKVEITSQNHGFAVDADSVRASGGEITHLHLNDGTVAGFRLKERPVFSVQYHPEASPGPHDSAYLFDEFVRSMGEARAGRGSPVANT